jgi:hypothetical protein
MVLGVNMPCEHADKIRMNLNIKLDYKADQMNLSSSNLCYILEH